MKAGMAVAVPGKGRPTPFSRQPLHCQLSAPVLQSHQIGRSSASAIARGEAVLAGEGSCGAHFQASYHFNPF